MRKPAGSTTQEAACRAQGSQAMFDEILRSVSWVGLGIGLVLLVTVLELLLRGLVSRYGTPQG
jgi:hypothetical protein